MPNKRDIELLYELGTIRHIDRTWKQFLGVPFANLAEHSYRVIWIALLLAKYEKGVDTGKLVKMALAHDVSESRTGDVHYISRQYADRKEELAIEDIFKGTALAEEMTVLVKEYETRESIEAKIVKDADNLDVDFELAEQKARGHSIADKLNPARSHVAETKLYTKTAKEIWKLLSDVDPHDWHVNGRNRFLDGDWKK